MKKILTVSSLTLLLALSGCSSKNSIDGTNGDSAAKLNSMKTSISDSKVETSTIGADYASNSGLVDLNDFSGVNNIYFSFDKFTLSASAKEKLDQNVANFNEMNGNYNIKVEGNCDEWGTDQYNYALGLKRANEVKKYLKSQGIDENKMSLVSYGESNPVCSSHNQNCWKKNRRADIKLLP